MQNQLTFVAVFWKTNVMVINTEIHFLPVHESHTYALSRDTKHLRLDGQSAYFQCCQTTRVACVTPEGH